MITVEYLANLAISACEKLDAPYMLTGALAYNYYAIPRSTKDVDIVVNVSDRGRMARIIRQLEPEITFSPQVQFDTITWGRRHIGRPPEDTGLSVELFELFEDPFVDAQFQRRNRFFSPGKYGFQPLRTSSSKKSAGAAARISTTPATCSPCKDPKHWT